MSQLKVNSIVPVGGLPSGASGGGIIQVVEHIKSDVTSTTSTSFSDMSGMSATITPSTASNKILVMVVLAQVNSNDTVYVQLTTANNTVLIEGDSVSGKRSVSAGNYSGGVSEGRGYYGSPQTTFSKLHSPATISAVTYKLRWHVSANAGTGYINRSVSDQGNYNMRFASTITLMEVTA